MGLARLPATRPGPGEADVTARIWLPPLFIRQVGFRVSSWQQEGVWGEERCVHTHTHPLIPPHSRAGGAVSPRCATAPVPRAKRGQHPDGELVRVGAAGTQGSPCTGTGQPWSPPPCPVGDNCRRRCCDRGHVGMWPRPKATHLYPSGTSEDLGVFPLSCPYRGVTRGAVTWPWWPYQPWTPQGGDRSEPTPSHTGRRPLLSPCPGAVSWHGLIHTNQGG